MEGANAKQKRQKQTVNNRFIVVVLVKNVDWLIASLGSILESTEIGCKSIAFSAVKAFLDKPL
jgi:hypothetical protein